jgi:alkanesulfonate monooxygenase SsuD/methylene tetrahydromethanopterin reductase-like flavin-dependent oxidoreductase (luciferase family)
MKFQLAINLERLDLDVDMEKVESHTLEMVQMADHGGFSTVWAAEHHALEMTIAPNPFQILTWWAAHTERIRLGCAVAVAAYWHPINLAGEAAFTDLISGGRLDFGIGSGAYQREFDRMHPGLKQSDAYRYMQEMLPVLKELWAGDYEHDGEFWQFPTSTSCPKPIQQPHPPVWVAARSPITFDWAVQNGCDIMSWPIARPYEEMVKYRSQLDDALAKFPDSPKPEWAMMRHAAVYDDETEWMVPVAAAQRQFGMFTTLFAGDGGVTNGVPAEITKDKLEEHLDYNTEALRENLLFGTPAMVIEKLRSYEALGVDYFIYYASMGLGLPEQKRSLELFIDEVMPAFA